MDASVGKTHDDDAPLSDARQKRSTRRSGSTSGDDAKPSSSSTTTTTTTTTRRRSRLSKSASPAKGKPTHNTATRRSSESPGGFWTLWRSSPSIPSADGGDNLLTSIKSVLSPPTTPIASVVATRPINLPVKSEEEQRKHLREFERMRKAFAKKEELEAKQKQKALEKRLKREDLLRMRTQEWLESIIPHWNDGTTTVKRRKTRELVWAGVPPNIRGKVWPTVLRNDLDITPEYYTILVKRLCGKDDAMDAVEDVVDDAIMRDEGSSGGFVARHDIVLDLPRTFPMLSFFQDDGPLRPLLKQILEAYALYRPDVGYVQGMSYMAAMLLLYLDEYDAFVCLANMLNRPMCRCFYKLGMGKINKYISVLDEMMKDELPLVNRHLKHLGISPELYIVDWFLTAFCKSLPLDIAARLWDIYIMEGDVFLLRAAIGVLSMYKSVLSTKEFEDCLYLLTHIPKDMNEDRLVCAIRNQKITTNKIEHLLRKHGL